MEARDGYGRDLETEDERGEELKGEKIRLTGVGIHADRLGPDLAGRREGIYNILFVMHYSWIFATDKKKDPRIPVFCFVSDRVHAAPETTLIE